jgi:hypothetical protein
MNLDSFRTLGRSGLRVSPITLGAMTFGDGSWVPTTTPPPAFDRYLEVGGTSSTQGRKAIMQQVDFPADLLQNIAPSFQQAGATINSVESTVPPLSGE